jgi:hypothetical protein
MVSGMEQKEVAHDPVKKAASGRGHADQRLGPVSKHLGVHRNCPRPGVLPNSAI